MSYVNLPHSGEFLDSFELRFLDIMRLHVVNFSSKTFAQCQQFSKVWKRIVRRCQRQNRSVYDFRAIFVNRQSGNPCVELMVGEFKCAF